MYYAYVQMKKESNGTRKGWNTEHYHLEVHEAEWIPGLFDVVGISLEFI